MSAHGIATRGRHRHRAHKGDTIRWCSGKVGREHRIEPRLSLAALHWSRRCTAAPPRHISAAEIAPGLWWQCWEQRVCTTCGKNFGYIPPKECTELTSRLADNVARLPESWRGGVTQAQVDAFNGGHTPIVWVSDDE